MFGRLSLAFHEADDTALVAGYPDAYLVVGQSLILLAVLFSLDVGLADLIEGLVKLNLTRQDQGVLVVPQYKEHLIHPVSCGCISITIALRCQAEAAVPEN